MIFMIYDLPPIDSACRRFRRIWENSADVKQENENCFLHGGPINSVRVFLPLLAVCQLLRQMISVPMFSQLSSNWSRVRPPVTSCLCPVGWCWKVPGFSCQVSKRFHFLLLPSCKQLACLCSSPLRSVKWRALYSTVFLVLARGKEFPPPCQCADGVAGMLITIPEHPCCSGSSNVSLVWCNFGRGEV